MILYTRNFWSDHYDNVLTRTAYNLSMYNKISVATTEKCEIIAKAAEGKLQKGTRFLVAEINYPNSEFAFALLDVNRPEVLQKLLDSIIAAIAQNKSVFYVDDFYMENGLTD